MCVCVHDTGGECVSVSIEVREQLGGVGSLLPLVCGSQELNSDHQACVKHLYVLSHLSAPQPHMSISRALLAGPLGRRLRNPSLICCCAASARAACLSLSSPAKWRWRASYPKCLIQTLVLPLVCCVTLDAQTTSLSFLFAYLPKENYKLGIVAKAYNPSILEAEVGRRQV